VGGDEVSYGAKAPEGKIWRQHFLQELEGQLDLSRIHFLGTIAYQHYLALLQISTVHVYLTYPFILSWSLLEAMACGCAIVASKTAPVQEVIEDQQDGLLVDFFSQEALVDTIVELIENPHLRHQLGAAARQKIIANYDLRSHCLPQQMKLIEGLRH
jgi:glycosyltransferase involved in cell wall biosynthesis